MHNKLLALQPSFQVPQPPPVIDVLDPIDDRGRFVDRVLEKLPEIWRSYSKDYSAAGPNTAVFGYWLSVVETLWLCGCVAMVDIIGVDNVEMMQSDGSRLPEAGRPSLVSRVEMEIKPQFDTITPVPLPNQAFFSSTRVTLKNVIGLEGAMKAMIADDHRKEEQFAIDDFESFKPDGFSGDRFFDCSQKFKNAHITPLRKMILMPDGSEQRQVIGFIVLWTNTDGAPFPGEVKKFIFRSQFDVLQREINVMRLERELTDRYVSGKLEVLGDITLDTRTNTKRKPIYQQLAKWLPVIVAKGQVLVKKSYGLDVPFTIAHHIRNSQVMTLVWRSNDVGGELLGLATGTGESWDMTLLDERVQGRGLTTKLAWKVVEFSYQTEDPSPHHIMATRTEHPYVLAAIKPWFDMYPSDKQARLFVFEALIDHFHKLLLAGSINDKKLELLWLFFHSRQLILSYNERFDRGGLSEKFAKVLLDKRDPLGNEQCLRLLLLLRDSMFEFCRDILMADLPSDLCDQFVLCFTIIRELWHTDHRVDSFSDLLGHIKKALQDPRVYPPHIQEAYRCYVFHLRESEPDRYEFLHMRMRNSYPYHGLDYWPKLSRYRGVNACVLGLGPGEGVVPIQSFTWFAYKVGKFREWRNKCQPREARPRGPVGLIPEEVGPASALSWEPLFQVQPDEDRRLVWAKNMLLFYNKHHGLGVTVPQELARRGRSESHGGYVGAYTPREAVSDKGEPFLLSVE